MAKVITFSRNFPAHHPRKGEATFFIEKFCTSIDADCPFPDERNDISIDFKPKHHTIRAGKRWEVGDWFSPRCWSGKPYKSKQIIFARETQIKKVWDIEIKTAYKELPLDYDTDIIINHRFYHTDDKIMKQLAENDGLSLAELLQWFQYPKPFQGQIICWNENIEY